MKQLGILYEPPMARLIDKNCQTVGECLDSPNAIAYAMSQDERISMARTLMGYKSKIDYSNRFIIASKEFTAKTAYWKKL